MMMRLRTALQVIILSQAYCELRDNPMDYPPWDQDKLLYFDRMVSLTIKFPYFGMYWYIQNVGTGVFISPNQILTSYNPFRSIIDDKFLLKSLFATVIVGRMREKRTFTNRYSNVTYDRFYDHIHTRIRGLSCGRQIQFLPDEHITERNLWHGLDQMNCPLHDLMVFRINGMHRMSSYSLGDITTDDLYVKNRYKILTNVFLTELAGPGDYMGAAFKYCEVIDGDQLDVITFQPEDNAEVDCDMWLLRGWGRFICIIGKTNRQTLTSGAMLVSNHKVFGVGSYVLTRFDKNILVFTDVRPYKDIILKTCTFDDSNETSPYYYIPSYEENPDPPSYSDEYDLNEYESSITTGL